MQMASSASSGYAGHPEPPSEYTATVEIPISPAYLDNAHRHLTAVCNQYFLIMQSPIPPHNVIAGGNRCLAVNRHYLRGPHRSVLLFYGSYISRWSVSSQIFTFPVELYLWSIPPKNAAPFLLFFHINLRSRTAPTWASASKISTPGITGSSGKWPAKSLLKCHILDPFCAQHPAPVHQMRSISETDDGAG